jgi:hypothetical protein
LQTVPSLGPDTCQYFRLWHAQTMAPAPPCLSLFRSLLLVLYACRALDRALHRFAAYTPSPMIARPAKNVPALEA